MTARVTSRTIEPEGLPELYAAREAMEAQELRAQAVRRLAQLDGERAKLVSFIAGLPQGNRKERRASVARAQRAAQVRLRAIEREKEANHGGS